jgi:hypothetical protein
MFSVLGMFGRSCEGAGPMSKTFCNIASPCIASAHFHESRSCGSDVDLNVITPARREGTGVQVQFYFFECLVAVVVGKMRLPYRSCSGN